MNKKNNVIIKLSIILIIIIALVAMTSVCFGNTGFSWDSAFSSVENSENQVEELNSAATGITGAILSVVKYVATGIALIMIVVIAAKYMIASAGDRADIKKHAVAYVTGALILFGSAAIVDILQEFAAENISTGTTTAANGGT